MKVIIIEFMVKLSLHIVMRLRVHLISEKWFLQQNIMSAFSVQFIQPLSFDEIYRLGYQRHLMQQKKYTNQAVVEC